MAMKVTVPKKTAEVSLSETLLSETTDSGVNVSEAPEARLARPLLGKRAELWLKENADAIVYYNA